MRFEKKINYIDGYKISLTFDDKKTKVVDIEPYLDKGIFLTLRDPDYFNLVKVKYDTIAWPNEADFCPDLLYEIGELVQEAKKEPKKKKSASSSCLSQRPSEGMVAASRRYFVKKRKTKS